MTPRTRGGRVVEALRLPQDNPTKTTPRSEGMASAMRSRVL